MPLCRIYDQQSPFTGSNGTGYFVGKVNVSGSINQIEQKFFTFVKILHLYRVTLDGDPALPFQIHVVQHLSLHVAGIDRRGHLQQTVGQRTLSMVNMGYDAKIPGVIHV